MRKRTDYSQRKLLQRNKFKKEVIMAASKRGLGKGLDALIPTGKLKKEEAKTEKDKIMVELSLVEPDRSQPRKQFDEDSLNELSESIGQVGILQPLIVSTNGDRYTIIAGERRWRAARKAGIREVPIIIRNDLTAEQIAEIQIIENIQRENLNAIEEAKAYERLINEFHLKQDEVAKRVSKSRTAITNIMRLLKLNEKVQEMVVSGDITSGHARALLSLENHEDQLKLAEEIRDNKLSVREIENAVKNFGKIKKEKKARKPDDQQLRAIYKELEDRCKQSIGTKIVINPINDKGIGEIKIEFYSNEDLEKISAVLLQGR